MPKTAPGRFPVPLRSSEADMLKELESLKGVYGGINERMREWLMRGLKELEQRTQQVPSAGGDATRALLAVATELTNSVAISQHLLLMYMQAKDTLAMAPKTPVRPAALSSPSSPPASDESPSPTAMTPAATADSDTSPEATQSKPRWSHLKGLVGG